MKIGQPGDVPVASTQPAPLAPVKGGSGKPASGAGATARSNAVAGVAVTVSSRVAALQQAGQSDAADVDLEKVEAVRGAIADGSYQVNAQAIADKLLGNAQEMLARTSH